MDITTLMFYISIFYGVIFFIDQFMKSCMNMPYICLLENLGLSVQPFHVNIFSTLFNRSITRLGIFYKKWFNLWFSIGSICVVILLLPSLILLFSNLISQLNSSSERTESVLQPVVPGINLPIEELPFYFMTLLIASLFHEAGHALAAVGEDIHINGIGFLVLFILPGAYVDLPKRDLNKLSPFKQLKILCAGVWHNVVLMFFAYGIGLCLPTLLQLFYKTNSGIIVLNLDENSPVRGPKGLNRGDVIESVNFCSVSNVDDWTDCLLKGARNNQVGFCIPQQFIINHDTTIHHPFVKVDNSVECCDTTTDGDELCFELKTNESSDMGEALMQPYSCLPARSFIDASTGNCVSSAQCPEEDFFCLAPSLQNSSRFLSISRHSLDKFPAKNVLYLGSVSELYFSVKVANYIPKIYFLSMSFPYCIELLLDYIIKFSGALGIMNLIPCVYLDGFWISKVILEIFTCKCFSTELKSFIHMSITIFGTGLLLATMLLGVMTVL